MNWNKLTKADTLQDIQDKISHEQPVLIFKHSTRCSVSSMALDRLERKWDEQEMQEVEPYFLDLIANRDISNKIAELFGVPHQSPQVLIIKNGKAIYDNSHMGISYQDIKQNV